jgi:ABC-type transport system involved in cytochrome c biogenesis ATPase subunit
MRLRYIHLEKYPPIRDIAVCFASGSPLQRECAIRFVVGVNGSGKSNLLRAVAEVFLALSDRRLPSFPVSLVYELGQRGQPDHYTFVVDCHGSRSMAAIWIAEGWHWPDEASVESFEETLHQLRQTGQADHFRTHVAPSNWPQDAGPALPKAVLAYTTGELRPWRSIWNRNQEADGSVAYSDDASEEERPADWSLLDESRIVIGDGKFDEEQPEPEPTLLESRALYRRPILLDATLLKCALLAVVLHKTFTNTTTTATPNGDSFQALLERSGWNRLVSVSFHIQLRPRDWRQSLLRTAHDWLLCASGTIKEPFSTREPRPTNNPLPVEERRTLYFDMKARFSGQDAKTLSEYPGLDSSTSHGEALLALIGGPELPPFELFTRLMELRNKGLFDELELRLRRNDKAEPGSTEKHRYQDAGVLRYEEISDGEQMFLGRMALLHLLQDQHDSLLLLDEPETHFNDLWKRDIVSIVDDALAHTSAEVMIATHAALVLTDALRDELVVLERLSEGKDQALAGTTVRVLGSDTHTFGATGDHPLRDIFGAPDTVGRRASRLLEVLIAAASLAEEMDAYWANGDEPHPDLIAKVLAIAAETEQGLTERSVADYLRSIGSFAEHFGANRPLRMKAVLEAFIQQTGPGYFQVELKRAWRRLLERVPHAA